MRREYEKKENWRSKWRLMFRETNRNVRKWEKLNQTEKKEAKNKEPSQNFRLGKEEENRRDLETLKEENGERENKKSFKSKEKKVCGDKKR